MFIPSEVREAGYFFFWVADNTVVDTTQKV